MRAQAWTCLLACHLVMGCARTVPPPESPRADPWAGTDLSAGVAAGFSRVAISTDVPARVERVASSEGVRATGVVATLVCAETPCAVTLAYGDYDLRFTSLTDSERTSRDVVRVRAAATALHHVLGQDRGRSAAGPIVLLVGAATLVAAAIVAVASHGPTPNPSNGPSGPSPDAGDPAPYIALGGLGVVGLGILFTAIAPSVHQDGATTYGSSQSGSAASPGTFGFRF